jgi:hypothetical protein
MNNSSLLTADRATHLKIVVVALVCATLIAGIGVANKFTASFEGSRVETGVIKAPKPLTAATEDNRVIR